MGFLNNLFAQPTPEEAEGYNVATTRQMVCFGMEGFPAIVFSGLISTFYMYFATNVAGITIEAAGVILAIASIFDAVTDPIFGTIVDKYKISKKYRYIPWYVMGVVFICIGMIGNFFWAKRSSPGGMDDVLLSSAGGWRHISNRIDQSAAKYLDQRAGAAFNFAFFQQCVRRRWRNVISCDNTAIGRSFDQNVRPGGRCVADCHNGLYAAGAYVDFPCCQRNQGKGPAIYGVRS